MGVCHSHRSSGSLWWGVQKPIQVAGLLGVVQACARARQAQEQRHRALQMNNINGAGTLTSRLGTRAAIEAVVGAGLGAALILRMQGWNVLLAMGALQAARGGAARHLAAAEGQSPTAV
jgi:hypothetical protein